MRKNNLEMIPVKKSGQNQRWDAFENAATHSYARSIVEKNKKKGVLTTGDIRTMSTIESDVIKPIFDQNEMIINLNKEICTMKSVLNDNRKHITEIRTDMRNNVQQINQSLQWIMKAMTRVKMNSGGEQLPNSKSLFVDGDAPELAQTTASF